MAPVKYFLVGAGLMMSVMADYIAFSEWPTSLTAGQPVTLKWTGGSDAPATITLRKGESTDLHDVQVLSSDATNGVFTWTPPADLQNAGDYAFQISQGDEINYTSLLPLSGGSDTPKENTLDKTQTDAASMSNSASASATETAASMTDMTESAATAASATSEVTGSTASDATGTTTASTTASENLSASTSGSEPTETATASKMNSPFVGSHQASSTASATTSAETGSAGRIGVSLGLLGGAAGFILLFL